MPQSHGFRRLVGRGAGMDEIERGAYRAQLRSRREEILQRIDEAARASGRQGSEVGLLAVSKTVGPLELQLAWEAGFRAFAENRPQELSRKLEAARDLADVRFDMIGNLQTNKVNQVIGKVELVHSVSSGRLADAIARRSLARQITTRVLLEVNVSGEASKSGFAPEELEGGIEGMLDLEGIEICGLMTMAPKDMPDEARRCFFGLRELRDGLRARTGLGLDVLSCGMSDDFQIAVEEGSNLVRLGRTIFDPNYVPKQG